jgi:hypothetical protein
MKYIKLFEKLGIEESIEQLADNIIERFKKDTIFTIYTDLFGKKIQIDCEYHKSLFTDTSMPILACIRPYYNNGNNNLFDLYTTTLDKHIIIHEIKHIHRVVKNINQNDRNSLISAGRITSNDYKHYFDNKDCFDIFYWIVYYSTQDEIESYYNEFYYELKQIIKDSDGNKKEIVKNFLSNQDMYQYIEFFYKKGEFRLDDYFKSNRDKNNFLKLLKNNLLNHKNMEIDKMKSTKFDILLSRFKKFLKLDRNIEDNLKLEKEINKTITNNIIKGFKKFQRLYILLT